MNKDEMNRAIAEACGWEPETETMPGGREIISKPPDYTTCLNAMAEAEQILGANASILYVDNILKVIDETLCEGAVQGCFYQVCATAEQRATAFLRTLTLYQDTRES